jgi:hypothetical protein
MKAGLKPGHGHHCYAAAVLFMCFCTAAFMSVSAHPPSDMVLAYDTDSQTLTVTLVHNVSDPFTHYVYRIEIKKNGTVYTVEEFIDQPTDSKFRYTFSVAAVKGDTIEVTADCNLGGSIHGELSVGDGTAEVEVPALWPIHAGFMSIGLLLMLGAVFNVLNKTPKTWWLKAHKTVGGLSVLLVIIGLVTAVYMVSLSSGGHFKVVHAYMGIITLLFSVMTPLVGFITLKKRENRLATRRMHILFGRITVILILVTIISGLLQAGVLS